MTKEDVSAVQDKCNSMNSYVATLAVCSALSQVYEERGDADAVEGCRQTMQLALSQIRECTYSINKIVLPLILLLLAPLATRADSFADHLAALEAANAAVKPATPSVAQEAPQQPRHGDTKPCTDGRGDWTYDASEGVWWRYRPDWIQPSAASLLESGGRSLRPGVRRAAGGCISGG